MANEIVGQKMSDYTALADLSQEEQETYLANAAVTTYGKTSVGGENTNVNVPLSAIKPDVPVTDVTFGGTSVVSSGVAAVPQADWTASSSATAAILHKPDLSIYAEASSLAPVATSGSYDDLKGKPNIPSIPSLPSGASDNEYVLGFKNGSLAWVKLEAKSSSGWTSYNVYYKE